MSHNYERTVWYKEGLLSLISGTTYGVTSIVVGHPMDTVKTKMQAQSNYMKCQGLVGNIKQVYNNEGFRGFYRGALWPLIGSTMFRGLQFSVFESVFTFFKDSEFFTQSIPYTMGV